MKLKLAIFLSGLIVGSVQAEPSAVAPGSSGVPAQFVANAPAGRPAPAPANVPYGNDPRQVLDFWKAQTTEPAPVLFFIHGGGWNNGDKNSVLNNGCAAYLQAGISVVSINYRFVSKARAAGVRPPVAWPLADAARALQFVRSKSGDWNLDKERIAGSGGSAGACSILWLAFHPDMSVPGSPDPVSRESTRLFCAAVGGAQTTLDPEQMKEWTPNSNYGGHAFGFLASPDQQSQFQNFLTGRDKILPWIREYSPYHQVSRDDPPVYLYYANPPAFGQAQKDPTHSANFGVGLMSKLKSARVVAELQYPGAVGVRHRSIQEFVMAKLGRTLPP